MTDPTAFRALVRERSARAPGLRAETVLVWRGFCAWLAGRPEVQIDPVVAHRLIVAGVALELADLLKHNERAVNREILGATARLLDVEGERDATH